MRLIKFYIGTTKGEKQEPIRPDQWDQAEELIGTRYGGFTRVNAIGEYRVPAEGLVIQEPSRVYEIIDIRQHWTEVDTEGVRELAGELARILDQLSIGWLILPVMAGGFAAATRVQG